MTLPSRSYQSESWDEYKRLVLAELERLNDCVDKLHDRHDRILFEHDRVMSHKISTSFKNLTSKIQELEQSLKISDDELDKKIISSHKVLNDKIVENIESIKIRVEKLEKDSIDNMIVEGKQGRFAFWATVLALVGSLVASIISIIVAYR